MTTANTNVPFHRTSPYSNQKVPESEIDREARFPVLLLLGFSIFWLMVATVLGLIASIQTHWPALFEGVAAMTHGRVRAAFNTAFLYGWLGGAALAIGLWVVSRLSQAPLRVGVLFTAGVAFWNIGILIGIVGIAAGEMTPYLHLEMPAFTGPLLLVSYILVALPGVLAFYHRRTEFSYIGQWFLVAALFGFPWIFSVAQLMLNYQPTRGTVQSIVEVWYAWGSYAIWLAPVALSVFYYFLPKILGTTVRYYYMARVGFWMYVIAALWPGVAVLAVGPVPAWVSSAGIMGHLFFLIPVAIVALNLFCTIGAAPRERQASIALRFILFGTGVFMVVHALLALLAFRMFQETLQFTFFQTAQWQALLYGFVSMVFFGAIYFIIPRLVRRSWYSARLVDVHYWASAGGLVLIVAALVIGGWLQGARMNNPEIAFIDVARGTLPWLVLATFGWLTLLIGHVAFACNVVASAVKTCMPEEESDEVLYGNPPELKAQTT